MPLTAAVFNRDAAGIWLSVHGARIAGIVIALLIAHALIRRLVPPAIRRAVVRNLPGAVPGEYEKRAETLSSVFVRVSGIVLLVLGIFTVLSEVGYSLTPVITGIGISGIAVGLGAQGLVKDTINGLLILSENQFRYGDFVTVAGVSGTVEDLNLRRTVLRDLDGSVHSVPNSAIVVASNHTRDYSGVSVAVLISNYADLEQALRVADETGAELKADPAVAAELIEAPRPARIEAMDEKGVSIRILGRVRPGAQASVTFAYRRRLKAALDAAGLHYTAAPAAPSPEVTSRPEPPTP